MKRLLMLFPEYADAVTNVQRLRDETLELRTQREQLRDELALVRTQLVADRTRMIDFLAKRGMSEPVFETSMVPGVAGELKLAEKAPVSGRKLIRIVTRQQLIEERNQRLSAVGALDDED